MTTKHGQGQTFRKLSLCYCIESTRKTTDAPYLPEPATEEARPALVPISDRTLQRSARAGRRVEIRNPEEARGI